VSDPVRERLDSLRARLILSSTVVSFHYHHEETVGDVGDFRVRCTLVDGERAATEGPHRKLMDQAALRAAIAALLADPVQALLQPAFC
jgi:hypothetical protein